MEKKSDKPSNVIDLSKVVCEDKKKKLKRSFSDDIVTVNKHPRIDGDRRPGTPSTFLEDANFYYNKNNLIQASTKLWLSAASAVEILFLKLNVLISSHNALKLLCEYAIDKSPVYDQLGVNWARLLAKDQFEAAEMFSRFTYGGNITKKTYIANKDDVAEFVTNFLKIKPEDVKNKLFGFLNDSKRINFEMKDGVVEKCGEKYHYKIECW
ncbi:hypothetical protein ACQ4LE_003803 [Meloidogyne hapla]